MPDLLNPQVPTPTPLQSTVTLQSVAMPHIEPTVNFYNSSANGGDSFSAADVRDALLGSGREIDYFNRNKTPADGLMVDYNAAKRYDDSELGYSPFRDNEDLYAREQGVLSSLGSGLGRVGLTALTKLGTGLGYLGGLVTSAFDPAGRSRYGEGVSAWLANASDNAFSYQFDKWEQGVKDDLLPIYQEASDRDKGFFSRAATDLNFWTEDVSDGAAFMISALAPGMAISKLNVGTRTLGGLAKLFGYSDEALDAARAAEIFGGSLKTGATAASTELKYVPKVLKIASNARAARSMDVGIQTLVSTASEAMFEANDTKHRIYDDLIAKGVSVEDAAQQAAQGARDTYLMNLAALSFSNLWEANLIFKKLPSTSTGALGTATREGLTGATRIERRGMLSDVGKSILKGIGIEGFYEENIQLAMQRVNEREPGANFATKIADVARQTAEQTVNAIMGKDTEAATSIGIGGIIGAGAGGIGSVREGISNEKYRANVEAALNSYGAAFQAMKNVYNADGTLNEAEIKKVAASQGNVLELMDLVDLAEKNQMPVLKDIYESELFSQFAHAHFQNGQAELLMEKLSNLDKLTNDDLQALGFDAQNKEGAGFKLQELKQQAIQLQGLYDNIQRNVIGTDDLLTDFRKAELFRLGARSITLNKQAQRVQTELALLNSQTSTDLTVSELNAKVSTLKAAQRFYEALQNDEALQPGSVDSQTLTDRKAQIDDLEKEIAQYKVDNERGLLGAKVDKDGYYTSNKATEDILTKSEKRKAELKLAEIQLSKNSVDERFQRIANPATGAKFTKQYYDKIVGTRNPRPTITRMPLGGVSTESYQQYEANRLRRQRIQSGLGDIEREMRSELLVANLPDADTDSILSLIDQALDENIAFSQDDKNRIIQALNDAIDGEIKQVEDLAAQYKNTQDTLGAIDPEDMLPEQEDEYTFVVNELPKIQDQLNALNGLKSKANALSVFTPVDKTDDTFRKEIAEEYFVEPEKIIKDIQQSSEGYDSPSDLENIDNQIKQLENLRDIFSEREDTKSSPEFKGFVDRISSYIDQLKDARKDVAKRVSDRSAADQKALNNHVNLTAQTIGIDLQEGTFNSVYTVVSSILNSSFPTEFANATVALDKAKEDKDSKKTLYVLESIQSLLKKAVGENAEISKRFSAEIAVIESKTLTDFVKQPGLSGVTRGNISENQIQDVYSKNPANVFRYIIDTISDQVYDLDRKDSPIYRYLQNLNVTEFLSNAKEDKRDGQTLSQGDLVALIQNHIAFQAITDLHKVIDSKLAITEEVENELNVINKSIAEQVKANPDTNVFVQTPSNEQLISLRQLMNFLFTDSKVNAFSNWAYLKGAAGTGKSQIISKWLLKLAKISTKDVFAIGHNLSSSGNINNILGKGDIAPLSKQLIEALNANQPMKLILIDEIGGFNSESLLAIQEAVDKYNKANSSNLKIIALGDPNQLTTKSGGSLSLKPAIETVQFRDALPFSGKLNNLTVISPLTIRYRSDVNQVNNFSDKFINQKQDLSAQGMIVTSNNPSLDQNSLRSTDLLGVVGTKNFKGALEKILPILAGRGDERTRAIITTPGKVDEYTRLVRDNGIDLTKVEVLSYLDAQGRTIDEVYVDIPNNKSEFNDNTIYNKAMYVATSRATNFVLVANYETTNELDNTMAVDKASKQSNIQKSSEAFKNDRTEELETLKSFVTIPTSQKVTDQDSEPEATKTTVDQTDIKESEEDEEENPAPPEVTPEMEDVAEVTIEEKDAAAVEKGAEVKIDFSKSGVHNLRFPTSEAATNIVVFEGSATPSYVSTRSMTSLQKRGQQMELRNSATSVGDKIQYVPAATKDGIFFVLVTPLKDATGKPIANRFRQIGVIGDQELLDMKDNPDLTGLYKTLSDYKNNPDSKALQIDLDKNELNIPNLISVVDGTVADIDYLNFEYKAAPTKFNLQDVVAKVVTGLFPNDPNQTKRINDIKKDAKILIYKASDVKPQPWMLPGVPYLVLSNLGQGSTRGSKALYVELSPRTLNSRDHQDYTAPIKEFVSTIEQLNSLMGDGDFVYGNAVFENAVIKIARRNTTGDYEVAGRTINVTEKILDLARKADALHIRPTSESIRLGSKVKYVNSELAFTAVGVHRNDAKDGSYKKGEKYVFKTSGEVSDVQTSTDPNTDQDVVSAVKVRYFELDENNETTEVETDFIPVAQLTNSKTENGKAQVALNSLWRANEAKLRESDSVYIEGEQKVKNKKGEVLTRRIFQYPSILRSESTNSGYNTEALNVLKAIVNFDAAGNHEGSVNIPTLRVPVPRDTSNVNFTNSGLNSINSAKVTSKYLQTNLSAVYPSRVSVAFDKAATKPATTTTVPTPATKKINIPRGRPLAVSAYSKSQLGKDLSTTEAKKFIKSKLPGLTDAQVNERVIFVNDAQMMRITGGRPAWGYFVDNLIYLQTSPDNKVKENVVRHEVAHYVFNNYLNSTERQRFIADLKKERPFLNFMAQDELMEYVDEFIAEGYQNYSNRKGITAFIKNILRKIANFLGFATPFIRSLNDYFDAIDQGLFSKPSNEQLLVGRPLLSIKEDFGGNVQNYLRSQEMFGWLINFFTNPTEAIVEDQQGNLENVPLSREEAIAQAMKYFQDRVNEFNAIDDKSTISSDDMQDYEVAMLLTQVDRKGRYRVFEDLVKDFYPNFRFVKIPGTTEYQAIESNKAFDYNYESDADYEGNLTDTQPSEEGEEIVAGNEGWFDDQDTVNPLKKASQAVKDFMASMAVKIGDGYERIRPGYVFYKLLQNLTGIDVNDLPDGNEVREEIKQIKANFLYNGMKDVEDESNRDWVIYQRLVDMLNETNVSVDSEGNRLPVDSYFEWRGDNQKGHYEFFNKGKIISGLVKGNKKPTDQFFKDIHGETRLPYETIKALYKKRESGDAINSIYMVINSMRTKSPMFGEYEWKWSKGKQKLKRIYGAFKDESSLAAAKAFTSNILSTRYSKLESYKDSLAGRKTAKNKVALAKSIMVDLGLIPNVNSVYIAEDRAVYLLNTFDAIQKASESIGQEIGTNPEDQTPVLYDAQEFTSDLKKYISQIAKVINSRKTEVGRSSSYIGGDNKPRWFFMNSTQAFDTFRKIIEARPLRGFMANNRTIFNWNIFNPQGSNQMSNVYSLRDHDSIGEIDSQRDPILYRRELTKDFIERNFMYGFVNFLGDTTAQGLTYLQQFYTISNKPNMLAAQIDLLSYDKVKEAIQQAIEQESQRVPKGIANYDTNINNKITYLVGLDEALTPEEAGSKSTMKASVNKVYTALEQRSKEAFDNYMSMSPVLDKNFSTVFSRLSDDYLDPAILKKYPEIEDISALSANFRFSPIDEEEFTRAVYPVFDLFYKNYFINSLFLNQIAAGDQAQYKDEYDEIKRMSMAFAIGYRGRVNDETGLRKTFNVGVAKDFKDVIGQDTTIGRNFKKLLGASYELTDAQGFMTPERASNIRLGFSREANLGATMKPVYFGIDNDGIARGVKYSTIELTNELVSVFPDLADLRYSMTFGRSEFANDPETINLYKAYIKNEISQADKTKYESRVKDVIDADNHVDELVFESAFKVGKPAIVSDWKSEGLIKPESVVQLTNDNYRHQLNPRHDSDTKTSNPSQLTYQINTNGKNFSRLRRVLKLNSLIHTYGLKSVMGKLFPNGDIDNAARRTVRRTIAEPLAKVPGNERYAEFINDPEISLNLPNITNKLQQSFLAYVSKRTIEIKHKGSKLVLQSSFGTTSRDILSATEQTEPRLVFVDAKGVPSYEEGFDEGSIVTYYMEVYLPNIYKNQHLNIGSEVWTNDPVYSNLMGFRIPSTELHSAVPLKVKGFYPSTYGDNVIIAPKELVVLHGSDFDIDSLYTINKFVSHADLVSPEGLKIATEGVAVGYKYSPTGGTTKQTFANNLTFAEWITEEMDRVTPLTQDENLGKVYQEYLDKITELLPQAASNDILDTFLETISAEENIQDMMSPISMGVFNDIEDEDSVFSVFANLLSEKETGKALPKKPGRHEYPSDAEYNKALKTWKDNAMKYIRPKRNLNLMDDEVEMHQDNFRASLGTGISANAFKIISYIFMGATNMNSNQDLTESQQALPALKEDYHIEIDGFNYNGFSRYIIKDGKPMDSGVNRTTTFQIIDSIINAAIDHVKEQILNVVNISNKTINAYISMIAMGVDPKIVSLFIAQPSLREMSDRSADRFALNNITGELRQALLKGFASEEYIKKYEAVEQDVTLKPAERNRRLRDIANGYFNNVAKVEDFENIKLTTAGLEASFKMDFDPSRMTKNQILTQLKVLNEFKKVDYLGDYLSKGSRALNSIRQIPSDFAQMENILQLYSKFFDVEAAITNADPDNVTPVDVAIPDRFPFSNVNLSTVLNISSSLNVMDEVMTATGKLFLREGEILRDFSDQINTLMLNAGISDMQDQQKSDEEEEYVKQYDRGFLDWNAAKSLQKIRQTFVEYLLTGVNFELPSGEQVSMSVTDEAPLEYTYDKTERDDFGELYKVKKTATATGVTAWTRRFVDSGIETIKDGKKVRLKPIQKLIQQYGFNSESPNNFLSNLQISRTAQTRSPYLRFAMGSSLDNAEKIDFENEFNNLKNLSIYETLEGKDIEPEALGDEQFNELQYNLLKYDIIANGLAFGSYSYSQVMSIPIFRQVSKKLDEFMFGLLDEKNPKFDINKVKDHFALQLALMNIDKVRAIGNLIELDKDRQPVFGYDETNDTYYDLIVKDYGSKNLKGGDLPTFAKRGSTLYVRVNPNKENVQHAYYQRVERFNETKSFSFNEDLLYVDNGYRLGDYFAPNKLAISALSIKSLKGNKFSIEVDPRFEPKVTLASPEDRILVHSPSDYSRMNAEEFEVISVSNRVVNGKQMVILQLNRLSSADIMSDFLKFSIQEAERANKEIEETRRKLNDNCK